MTYANSDASRELGRHRPSSPQLTPARQPGLVNGDEAMLRALSLEDWRYWAAGLPSPAEQLLEALLGPPRPFGTRPRLVRLIHTPSRVSA